MNYEKNTSQEPEGKGLSRAIVPGACSVKVENGVAYLHMPDGTRIPKQLGLIIENPISPTDGLGPVKVTVSVFANLEDTK